MFSLEFGKVAKCTCGHRSLGLILEGNGGEMDWFVLVRPNQGRVTCASLKGKFGIST